MEYITTSGSVGKILCCLCGIPIEPNPSNQCIGCIKSQHDITKEITKSASLTFCKGCERYLDPPSHWVNACLESKELLKICLKRIKGLNDVRLIDAGFSWTEPHSKRLKVRLVIQKEIDGGAILEQDFVVDFVVLGLLCDDCHRIEAKDYWNVVLQVRQKTDHKRTFYYLEQRILKHRMHQNATNIKPVYGGLDFYFGNEQNSNRMLDFLTSVVPCKVLRSKRLKSHDIHSNTFNFKHTVSVEIIPVCKDSIVCLPAKLAHQNGSIGQICIIYRITNNIFVIDPTTAQLTEISNSVYWRTPFNTIASSKKLTQFIVIDINDAPLKHFKGKGQVSHKHTVSEVWVQPASELGVSESIFCRSHLGQILNIGDTVLGYDLKNSNVNDENLEKMSADAIPDVILVKKIFGDRFSRKRTRKWKLKHLGIDDDIGSQNLDYMEFLEDLEEDTQMRSNVNIYRKELASNVNSELNSEVGEDLPSIALEEMISDLNIDDPPDELNSEYRSGEADFEKGEAGNNESVSDRSKDRKRKVSEKNKDDVNDLRFNVDKEVVGIKNDVQAPCDEDKTTELSDKKESKKRDNLSNNKNEDEDYFSANEEC